jgi:hypothetical protein
VLTQKISLSHHNTIVDRERYKGKAEKWYYPENVNLGKEIEFEHVWLDKINTENLRTKFWFKELVEDLNCSKYLTDVRWDKYWKEYHEDN